jgi:signal transduction histidine kinase
VDPLRRLRGHGDHLLAAALVVGLQLEVWASTHGQPLDDASELPTGGARLAIAVIGLALGASVAWRRRVPLAGLVLAFPMLAATGGGGLDGWPALLVTLTVIAYSVGSETRDGAALTGGLGVAGLVAAAVLRDPDALGNLGDLVVPTIVLGGAWLAGLGIRLRREQARAVAARAAELERSRAEQARTAVADERARIARDLHDVVAHAIGIIVVQARGGRRSIAADPAAAREALTEIETTAVGALAEMRRLVGVLRTDEGEVALAPRPGLRDLDGLVGRMRDAGLPVELRVEGAPVEVAPGIDVSAFRIVQEALTNVLRHAGPAAATVVVRYGELALDVMVTDTGTGAAGARDAGHGLAGMRERATLVGGSVEAGPGAGGGFVVRAHLPIEIARP